MSGRSPRGHWPKPGSFDRSASREVGEPSTGRSRNVTEAEQPPRSAECTSERGVLEHVAAARLRARELVAGRSRPRRRAAPRAQTAATAGSATAAVAPERRLLRARQAQLGFAQSPSWNATAARPGRGGPRRCATARSAQAVLAARADREHRVLREHPRADASTARPRRRGARSACAPCDRNRRRARGKTVVPTSRAVAADGSARRLRQSGDLHARFDPVRTTFESAHQGCARSRHVRARRACSSAESGA